MECHLGRHVFFRGEKLGLHLVGCEKEEDICDFTPQKLEIKDQRTRRKLGGGEPTIEM